MKFVFTYFKSVFVFVCTNEFLYVQQINRYTATINSEGIDKRHGLFLHFMEEQTVFAFCPSYLLCPLHTGSKRWADSNMDRMRKEILGV